MMNSKPCNNFASGTPDPTICRVKGCGRRLADHHKNIRAAWFKGASDLILLAINVRNSYLNQSNPVTCTIWRPKQYHDVVLCDCGRLEVEHNLTALARGKSILRKVDKEAQHIDTPIKCVARRSLGGSIDVECDLHASHTQTNPVHQHKGSRGSWAWTSAHTCRVDSVSCKRFDPVLEMPGRCRWCGNRYIDHSAATRGRHVEDYENFHSPTCASVIKTGHNICTCLTESVQQMMLDQLSVGKPITNSKLKPTLVEGVVVMPVEACSKFETSDLTEWLCQNCSKRFYDHEQEHREGFDSWTEWRAAHMSNDDVIQWFLDLGSDEVSRATQFRKRIDDYDFLDKTWPPSKKLIQELYSMLPLRVRNLVDSFKKPESSNTSSEERDTCFNCGVPLLKPKETSMCTDCVKLAVDDGPVKRYVPPLVDTSTVKDGYVTVTKFD